jgi:RNA polymerase sigma-70 factor (ECF subfamily)
VATSGTNGGLAWELRCVQEVQRGNRRAFVELYMAFAPPLYAEVLLPRLGNAVAAEEALAETFRAALEKLGDYRSQGGSIFGWLARIAVNKATDLHRERIRTGRALASYQSLIAPLRESEGSVELEVERRLDQRRMRVAVDEVLAELSPRYRRAIELRMLEDLPRPECAQRMDVTIGNFDVLLLRALRAFRAAWVVRHGEKLEEP